MYKVICIFLLFIVSGSAFAEQLMGKIVGVTDGDTVTLLTEQKKQVKIRLNEIDAPEKSQAFGMESKKYLSDICFGKTATVESYARDRYGRIIGVLTCGEVVANEAQIEAGMAWVYREYSDDQYLIDLENDARKKSIGLWHDSSPIPPWEYRRGVKAHAKVNSEAIEPSAPSGFSCGGKSKCGQMESCEEAMFYLKQCGVSRLDRDHDGTPCESICGN